MKILIVGLGGAGQRQLRILSQLLGDEAEFLAYRKRGRNPVITKAFQLEDKKTVEEEYGVKSYRELDEAIGQKPDVAVISNPTSEHASVALRLAEAGCDLFVEKPLSHKIDGLQELLKVCEKKSLVTYVGYQMRFHPCISMMKKIVSEKKLGRVLSCRAEVLSFMPGWHPYEDYRQLYAARKELGGGVILTESHELDYLQWFFGMPKKVFASGGKLSGYEMDVEDTASILMDYGKYPVHLNMCFVQKPPSRSCQVNCENGVLLWDGTNKLSVFDSSKDAWEHMVFDKFEREDMFACQMRHFLACLEGKEKPLVDFGEGLKSLRMALAAKSSMESGKPVVLE